MTQKEFAARMKMPEADAARLLRGDGSLTQEIAARLEGVLGVPAHFWSRLEAIYQEKAAKAAEENQRDAELARAPHVRIS